MKASVFCGCSYTEGIGLDDTINSPNLWVNLVHKHLLDTRLVNLGLKGSSNEEIFSTAIDAISKFDCKYLFVSWTELFRTNIYPSVELFSTKIHLGRGPGRIPDMTVNPGVTILGSYVEDIKNRFFDLQNQHFKILQILTYSHIIDALCKKLNITVFFLNSLMDIDKKYFDYVHKVNLVASETTWLTQTILNEIGRAHV